MSQLEFQTHPLKSEIVRRWESNQSNKSINEWLVAEHPEVVLSLATLCKHHRRHKFNKKRMASLDIEEEKKVRKKKHQIPIEDILWDTITQCRTMQKIEDISVKDWQYINQQLQSAVEKLMRIQGASGDSKDISLILSEIFAKLESEDDLPLNLPAKDKMTEEEKIKIVSEVDNENSELQKETAETL